MRRLLDGERFSHDGPRLRLHDALCEPRPIQAHLPILIGGSGPTEDAAHRGRARRRLEHLRRRSTRSTTQLAILRRALRRRSAATWPTIELTISFPIVIRDDAARRPGARWTRSSPPTASTTWAGGRHLARLARRPSPTAIRPYVDLGFSTVIVRLPAPYDRETIERIGEVARGASSA